MPKSRSMCIPIPARITLLLILGVMGLSSCDNDQDLLSPSERQAVEIQTRTMLENYQRDIRREGLRAEFRYLDDSEDFFWIPPGFADPIGYDSVSVIIRRNMLQLAEIDNSWDTLVIVPLNRNYATFGGRLSSTTVDSSGNRSRVQLLETGVLVRREDGWKLLSGQTAVLDN